MSFMAAAIGVGGALIGSSIAAGGAQSAAETQAAAERAAQDLQEKMFNKTMSNESPFLNAGIGATSQLNYLLGMGTPGTAQTAGGGAGTASSSTAGGYGSLLSPFTADTFKTMSPAYQFQLQQGGQGTLNQDAGSQGALSGAALKDLMSYNQNYANTSFNNAFDQYQTQQNNIFGRLNSIATLGQGAASNSATGASSFANSIGNSAAAQGAALGAGQVGAANAWSGGLQSAAGWLAGSQQSNSNPYGGTTAAPVPGTPYGSGGNSGDTYCDYALKKNLEPMYFDGMSGLRVYEFHYKTQADTDPKWRGFIAQEVLDKYPAAVSAGPKGFLKVDYDLIPTTLRLDGVFDG